MIEVFNAISNIAIDIEKEVFTNYDRFTSNNKSELEIENDVYNYCTTLIEKECEGIKSVKGVISKDKKQLCTINNDGKYIISYVAIDTMELLDTNFSLGTIFGIYENNFEADNLKASVYVTYGPTFQLVFASKSEGVKYFSYEHEQFVQKDSLKLEHKGKINSTAGGFNIYDEKNKTIAQSFFDNGYRLRFSNSLALDTHQILFKKGGIYMSPKTTQNPTGSLEVIFEAFPIAFIIELCSGEAIDGQNRILDIKNPELHQTTPIYFGSVDEITKVKSYF